jgi:hypothetical protein
MSNDPLGDEVAAYLAPHKDNEAVEIFARAMKDKMAISRDKGRRGWQNCSMSDLWAMLREHVEKGDPVDIANIAMMLWHNSNPTKT